jgi:hypothetical protein
LTVDALHMVLMAVLVFLVLRQVMPIASGLAGGASLNSFGFVSRSLGSTSRSIGGGMRHAGKAASAALKLAAPYVARRLSRTGDVVRSAAVRSDRNDDEKAGSDVEALGGGWREMDR